MACRACHRDALLPDGVERMGHVHEHVRDGHNEPHADVRGNVRPNMHGSSERVDGVHGWGAICLGLLGRVQRVQQHVRERDADAHADVRRRLWRDLCWIGNGLDRVQHRLGFGCACMGRGRSWVGFRSC